MFGKKILPVLVNILAAVSMLLALCAIFAVVTTPKGKAPSLFGVSVFRVISGSMEPEIQAGSLTVTKSVDSAQVKVGDVISFYSSDPQIAGMVNTHRVAQIVNQEGSVLFYTKGDANPSVDYYPVKSQAIIGKVVFSSPLLGELIAFAQNKYVFLLFIILPLAFIVAANIRRVIRLAKEDIAATVADEDEEKEED